ncbi:MAG: hypothetical protein LBJ70_04270, partial [Holosporales bacterium]|nr:hypothetical protein [Holosporales bacterium]
MVGKDPHYLCHRERLRARFEADRHIPAYELLELLLFLSRPRCDTKPLAKALLARFRTVNGVLAASRERLREVPGIGEQSVHVLKLVFA